MQIYGLHPRMSLKIQIEMEYVFLPYEFPLMISLAIQFPLSSFNDLRQCFYDAFSPYLLLTFSILFHKIASLNNTMEWLRQAKQTKRIKLYVYIKLV